CDAATGMCGVADGQECRWDDECVSGVCIDSQCSGVPGACLNDKHCAGGEFCEVSSGSCKLIDESNGSSCNHDIRCESNDCRPNGTCAPPAQIGSACSNNTYCLPVGYCSEGVCVERHAPDEECTGLDR